MRKLIKKIFLKNSRGFRFLFKLYDYRYWFPKYWLPVRWPHDILGDYANHKRSVSFIQIGSNNGMSGDHLYKYITNNNWRGVLIEPVPYLFEQLKKNYQKFYPNLIFENCAIAGKSGSLSFYRLQKSDLPGLPAWYEQLGSFNKEVILKHKASVPFFDELFIEDCVNAVTFEELLNKHSIEEVNLIHIDTEGYDFEIIKMIPFDSLNIELIMFEHKHLLESDYKKAIRLLRGKGYILGITDVDTIGIKKSVLNCITI